MRRVIILLIGLLVITLSGCIYHPDVQQGNVLTQQDINSLRKGMTKDQVRRLFSDPLLINIYADNRMVYVYTFQHGHGKMKETRLLIYFRNGRVARFWSDTNPPEGPINLPKP